MQVYSAKLGRRGLVTKGPDVVGRHPRDPVHEIVVVGPCRDLEERWDSFLSGL